MEQKFRTCYVSGKKLGIVAKKNKKLKNKMDTFILLLDGRTVKEKIEYLIERGLNEDVDCMSMIEIYGDKNEDEMNLAINQFLDGYIKGKNQKEEK